ncbi:MAG: TlpA family protein disulfide reductase [Lachnospiraceae bacterium]|nr:TlpA family protein disulfide reductase [Lachnospiraceae bacterium]
MKKKAIATVVLATMLVLQGCGSILNPASVATENEDIVLLGEGKSSEASVSEESTDSVNEDYYYGDYKELSEGDRAPWFAAELADGGTFEMADLQGKVILINFWATWCGPCVGEMPAFESLYKDYADNPDVAIVAVDVEEKKKTVDFFAETNGYTFPIAYDEDGKIGMQYPTSGIPYTVIVGKDGYIRTIHLGARDADTQYEIYKADIEAALSE